VGGEEAGEGVLFSASKQTQPAIIFIGQYLFRAAIDLWEGETLLRALLSASRQMQLAIIHRSVSL